MSDFKFYPQQLPKALQSAYAVKHKANILRTQMSDGYVRQRLVNQGAPDTVSVQIVMTESQYRDFVQWYKSDIQCGAWWFVMPLLAVDADIDGRIQYRYCRIQNGEFSASVVSTNVKNGTIYRVSMTLDVSNTVVDDGTWHDGGKTAAGDDEVGDLVIVSSLDSVDDLDDAAGVYAVVEE